MFGDLEKTYSAIFSEKMCRRFGEIVRRFWRKPFGDFGEKRLALALEIWRNLFAEIVVGDLEKSFGDLGENSSASSYWRSLWSIAMLSDRTW